MNASSSKRSPSECAGAPPLSRYIHAERSRRDAPPRSSKAKALWRSSVTTSRIKASSMPPRAVRATGCAISCSTIRPAPTASTAGSSPATSTSTEAGDIACRALRREPAECRPPALRQSMLLIEREARGLSVGHVLVFDHHRLAIGGGREANHVRDLALAVIGLLDGVRRDALQTHRGMARIARHRVFLAIELR